jgi:putative nucleotidyltransferase with HDIG domain
MPIHYREANAVKRSSKKAAPQKSKKPNTANGSNLVFLPFPSAPNNQLANTDAIPELVLESVRAIVSSLEEKDVYTHGHSVRVAEYSVLLAQELNLTEQAVTEVELCAILHDIGKIGIPDNVLLKPARLTNSEFEIMKSHPMRSARILEKVSSFQNIIPGIKYHHERYDGQGYPEGLKGEAIPLYARIILIADTYDAMTSTRPYRLALDRETAFEELIRCSGTQFDKNLVTHFINALRSENAKRQSPNRVSRNKKIA